MSKLFDALAVDRLPVIQALRVPAQQDLDAVCLRAVDSRTALATPDPITMPISGPEALTALCGGRATVIRA